MSYYTTQKCILVLGNNVDQSRKFLSSLMDGISFYDIHSVTDGADGKIVGFGDDDTIIISTSLGYLHRIDKHKYHLIYLPNGIDKQIVYNTITPLLVTSDSPKDKRIIYY